MKILVDGQLVEYTDEGKGRTVLLLHGWGMSLGAFDDMAKNLSSQYRVIRLDFPGFGASPKPSDEWGVGEYAELVGKLTEKLKLDLYAVIGHSFGGRVIIKGVANGIIHTDKVVLIGAAGVKPPQSAKKALFNAVAKVGKAATIMPGLNKLRPMLRKKLYSAAGSTDYLHADAMKKIFLNTINEDLLPLIHRVACPTLLIWGEYDMEAPLSDAYKMMNELPDAQLCVINDAGHFVYIDDPLAVGKELGVFLK